VTGSSKGAKTLAISAFDEEKSCSRAWVFLAALTLSDMEMLLVSTV
jgi:hypothetical protein